MFGQQDDMNGVAGNNMPPTPDATAQTDDTAAVSTPAQAATDSGMGTYPSITSNTNSDQSNTPSVDLPTPTDAATVSPVADVAAPHSTDELLDIKQQALQQLSPLVGHLDQSPEDKFRTTMMMIQASDNSSLIKEAYEAAQAIPDEKTKAQALLDIVNEINYFTQHQEQ